MGMAEHWALRGEGNGNGRTLGFAGRGEWEWQPTPLSGTIIRGTLKTPKSQLVTPISTKLQRPDGCD
jgi:hypothetical protein